MNVSLRVQLASIIKSEYSCFSGWDGKGPGFESDQDLFFSNGKYSVSNRIIGQLFVCLSVVGLFVKSWNCLFCCAHFLLLRLVFCFFLQFVFLLDFVFPFFVLLKKFLGLNYFGLFLFGLMT